VFSVMLATCNVHALLPLAYQPVTVDIHMKGQSIAKIRRVNATINTKDCLFGFYLSKIDENNAPIVLRENSQFFGNAT
jgi:hypothetical protein